MKKKKLVPFSITKDKEVSQDHIQASYFSALATLPTTPEKVDLLSNSTIQNKENRVLNSNLTTIILQPAGSPSTITSRPSSSTKGPYSNKLQSAPPLEDLPSPIAITKKSFITASPSQIQASESPNTQTTYPYHTSFT